MLSKYISEIQPLSREAMEKCQKKWDSIGKPLRSLGRLEDMIIQLSGITGSEKIGDLRKAVLIFCSDNGVVKEGISQSGSEITAKCAQSFAHGTASVNSLCRVCGADTFPVDIGICTELECEGLDVRKAGFGTADFAVEPAMTRQQAQNAILTGIRLVEEKKKLGYSMIITGEMGIGNTTTSSAVLSVLEDISPREVTGRGAGLTSEGVRHKAEVIEKAIRLHRPDRNDVIDVLSKVGGFDICGMAGAFIGGAVYRVPVVIDGFISAVAALCAVRLAPLCRDYMFASHVSAEPAGRTALDALGKKAYLECGMCLGEGTGGVIGAKLFDFALSVYNSAACFDELNIEKYELLV